MNKLGLWGLSIALAFLAGSIVTGAVVFADDALTKLQKKCAKEPKNPQKLKPDCELLALFFGLQTQVDDLEERVEALENPPPPPPPPPPGPKLIVFVDDQDVTTFSGPQIVKVVVNDPDLKDTDEAETEPDVMVNDQKLRMVQETSGNWFGYFSDRDSALIADSQVVTPGTGSDFGVFCSKDSGFVLGPTIVITDTEGFAIQDPALVTNEVNGNPDATPLTNLCTDPVPNATPNDLMNVLDAGTITPGGFLPLQGQIGIRDGFWPFIQLYPFDVNDEVMIQYNLGGGPPEEIILTFVGVPEQCTNCEVHIDSIVPSPSGDIVTIKGSGFNVSENVIITIFSEDDQEVVQFTVRSTGTGEFSTVLLADDDFPPGTYTVKTTDGTNSAEVELILS